MADKTWKRVEREKCRALGGERSGPLGRDCPDCIGIEVGLEVKSYKKFVWLTEDWRQAKENAAKFGLSPVLAVKERGYKGRDRVQMHSALWLMFEIAAGNETFVGASSHTTTHRVDGDEVTRMSWDYFVSLYKHFYKGDTQ